MLEKVRNHFVEEIDKDNLFENKKKTILINGLLFILMIVIVEEFILFFGLLSVDFPLHLLFFVVLTSLVIFWKTQAIALTTNFLVGGCFVIIFSSVLKTGGIYSLDLVAIILIPLLAFAFGSKRSGIFWSLMYIVSLLFYFVLEHLSDLDFRVDTLSFDPTYYLVLNLAIFSITTGLFYIFTSTTEKLIKKLIDQKKKIIAQSNELMMIKEQIQESNEELERYAYATAHDLKQPIRAISSFSELLRKDVENNRITEDSLMFLNFILNGSKDMENLITDLLLTAKMNNGLTTFKKTNLRDITEIVLNGLSFQIKNSGAIVLFKEMDIELMVTPAKIIQLFQNLISNAIKYQSPDKKPMVTILMEEKEDFWKFKISDNGIGIPLSKQSYIFDSFTRVQLDEEEFEGKGIGLNSCKRIVEQHNGKIWVVSEVNKGSDFYFTISKKLKNSKIKNINDISLPPSFEEVI